MSSTSVTRWTKPWPTTNLGFVSIRCNCIPSMLDYLAITVPHYTVYTALNSLGILQDFHHVEVSLRISSCRLAVRCPDTWIPSSGEGEVNVSGHAAPQVLWSPDQPLHSSAAFWEMGRFSEPTGASGLGKVCVTHPLLREIIIGRRQSY